AGIQQLGSLEMRELRVQSGSSLAGKTMAEAAIGARTGASVVGQWVSGKLLGQPTGETRIEPRSILVVIGTPEALEALERLAEGAQRLRREGPFLIAGFGEVGQKVHELLTDAGEEVIAVDREQRPNVTFSGNVLDPSVLEKAGIASAQAVILALDSDDSTLFGTVIIRDLSPHIPVIARVNQARNIDNIYRAGADFALSISNVSGQMLSWRLFGEEALSLDAHLRIQRISGREFVGRHPSDLAIRERTQCSVVVVERAQKHIVEFGPEFVFEESDSIYICGTEQGVRAFLDTFGMSRS
ncbi:MAG: TrkA C-terminal domain-containing protein, partial [Thermoanaerobaculia bacterium]